MNPFRLTWNLHKWIGLAVGLILIASAATGLLLLVKKDYDWIQPPTMKGTAVQSANEFRPLDEVFAAAFAHGVPQLQSLVDVSRIDFRPDKGVHKIHATRDHVEVQVDAVTLAVTGPAVRRSDWIESLHDGSLFGAAVHGWLMPAFAVLLIALAVTGYAIWIWPKVKKRKRAAARARAAP